jgi:hypothetical protein
MWRFCASSRSPKNIKKYDMKLSRDQTRGVPKPLKLGKAANEVAKILHHHFEKKNMRCCQ